MSTTYPEKLYPYEDYLAEHPNPREWPDDGCHGGLGIMKGVLAAIDESFGGEGGSAEGLTIGLFGGWGTGKTSLLKGFEYYFGKITKEPVIFFEAWRYQNEPKPIIPLLNKLAELSIIEKKGLKEKVLEIAAVSVIGGMDLILKTFTKGTLSVSMETVDKYLEMAKKVSGEAIKEFSEYDKIKEKLSEVVNKLTGRKKKLIILIDDLDRCLPDKAVAVLETLRFFFSLKRTAVILAVDDGILGKYLEDQYRLKNNELLFPGKEFLQKLVHWSKELPHVHMDCLKEHLGLRDPEDREALGIFEILEPLTYRTWGRIVNRYREISGSSGAYRALEAILRECFPAAEDSLRRRPSLREALERAVSDRAILKTLEKDKALADFFRVVREDKNGYYRDRGDQVIKAVLEGMT